MFIAFQHSIETNRSPEPQPTRFLAIQHFFEHHGQAPTNTGECILTEGWEDLIDGESLLEEISSQLESDNAPDSVISDHEFAVQTVGPEALQALKAMVVEWCNEHLNPPKYFAVHNLEPVSDHPPMTPDSSLAIHRPIIATDALDNPAVNKRVAMRQAIYFTGTQGQIKAMPNARPFKIAYKKRYGSAPVGFAAHAYDATRTAIRAITLAIKESHGKPQRQAVAKYVRQTNFEGITGHIHFNNRGDLRLGNYFVTKLGPRHNQNTVVTTIRLEPLTPAMR